MEGKERKRLPQFKVFFSSRVHCRIVLVGDLVPSSEKWERIIVASGGSVQISKGKLTNALKEFVVEANEGMRLCVCPKEMRKNRLLNFLENHGFLFVPTDYVIVVSLFDL